jgi:hypothetical protein
MSLSSSTPEVAVRQCDGCTLCCRVMKIEALKKPKGILCTHCDENVGCKIYATKPQECNDFHCLYLLDPSFPPEWKPSESKIVLTSDQDGRRIVANVDPLVPDAWKKEPFHSMLRTWSQRGASKGGQVLAVIGTRTSAILPDRDVDLGSLRADQMVLVEYRRTGERIEWNAKAVNKSDSAASLLPKKL